MRSHRIAFVMLVAAGALAASSCSSGSSPNAAKGTTSNSAATTKGPYTLSELDTTPSFLDLPTFAVIHTTAKKYNLTISESSVIGGGAANQEFAGGQGDILTAGVTSPMKLLANGSADVTVIGSISYTNVWVLVSKAGSQYKTLKSLKGQKVGISGPGALSTIALRQQLKATGMNPTTTVQIVALGSPGAQLAALESGNAQAVQLVAPLLQSETDKGAVQVVDDMRTQKIASLVVTARTSAVKANPGAYCAYESALKTAMTKIFSTSTYATQRAEAEFGKTFTATQIKVLLKEYLNDHFVKSAQFTKTQYTDSKQILLGSGKYPANTIPSYAALTKNAPKC